MCDLIIPNMTQLLQRELSRDEFRYMNSSRVSGACNLYLVLRTFHTPESTAWHSEVKRLKS